MPARAAWVVAAGLLASCEPEPPPAPPHGPDPALVAADDDRRPFEARLAAALDAPPPAMPRPARFGPGPDLAGWTVWLDPSIPADPAEVVRVVDGALHVLDVEPTDRAMPFGCVLTEEMQGDFLLSFEYRWEGPRFRPRHEQKRDSGVLYLVPEEAEDAIWPTAMELQIQEGDTGDVHQLWGRTRPSYATTQTNGVYDPDGARRRWTAPLRRRALLEHPTGWNRVELVVRGGAAVHVVNGTVNARVFDVRDADGRPRTRGRVGFQVEGAQITYRAIRRLPLDRVGRPARVLAYTGAAGYRHASIDAAVEALRTVASARGAQIAVASRPDALRDVLLAAFDAVVLVSTTGDFLDDEAAQALQHFLRSGGGVIAIHGAADAEYDRPWYGEMIGGVFARHSPVEPGVVEVAPGPLAGDLPARFEHADEWYEHRAPPPADATVVLTIERDGRRLPLAWARRFDGGRVFYTALGHAPEAWARPELRAHLAAALSHALGEAPSRRE